MLNLKVTGPQQCINCLLLLLLLKRWRTPRLTPNRAFFFGGGLFWILSELQGEEGDEAEAAVEGSSHGETETHGGAGAGDDDDDDDDVDVPEMIEEVLDMLLTGLGDKDTIVRYACACACACACVHGVQREKWHL